jgi:hypothetical protein
VASGRSSGLSSAQKEQHANENRISLDVTVDEFLLFTVQEALDDLLQ